MFTVVGIRCPEEERVRLFILFEKQESAVKVCVTVLCRNVFVMHV